jgi:CheY-like chemotaxis protein/phosphoribosyl 1,2-cyclic phosphodiesterase
MAAKVLIVDDDYIAGGLSRDLLKEGGFDVELLTESLQAMDKIKKDRPTVVLLDILMPGIDGLTLCNQITSDPDLKAIKVVVLSGKSFAADKERARKYGASLFIEKPYSVETFVRQIQQIAGETEKKLFAKAADAQTLSASDAVMSVKIWGCRAMGPESAAPSVYGRKTPCVSVEIGGHLLIFDAGSGLVDLGKTMSSANEAWLFMTHFKKDHAEGLPRFAPAGRKGFKLHIAGAKEPDKTLEQQVADAFQCVPATIPSVDAEIDLYEMLEDAYDALPGVKITSFYANHPGMTLGYIVETKGRKFVYCPDSELYGETATSLQDYDEKLGALVEGADLLIHDGRYTVADYASLRNEGHSAFASAVDMAARSSVKKLLLMNFDAHYSDGVLDRMAAEAAQLCTDKSYALQVALAREGLILGV